VGHLGRAVEDRAVVPGRQADDVGDVRLLGELVDPGEDVDEVTQVVEAALRLLPALHELTRGALDLLARSGRTDGDSTAHERGDEPLWRVGEAHPALPSSTGHRRPVRGARQPGPRYECRLVAIT